MFTTIPGGIDSTAHIGTINELFFWVFNQDHPLPAGQACTFESDNHTTLTLPHLTSIDFSTWPETTSYALLTQAMEQTNKAEHIASFFLRHATIEQLGKTPVMMVKALSSQLCDKLIKNGNTFKEKLCQCVCDHFASDQTSTVPGSMDWLINTPLLKPVLLRLQQQEIDVSPITQNLASWQISDFSHDDIKTLLTLNDCQRLFKQAFKLKQEETIFKLLLSGHCNQLASLVNDIGQSPLAFFACSGHLPGLEYLLKLDNPGINQKDINGRTPLHYAALRGKVECLRALLTVPGILINEKAVNGWTPLNGAARYGHAECLMALLTAPGILVNEKSDNGMTPLNNAARNGHAKCVTALLTIPGILVNEKSNNGWTPLHCAAKEGHTECLRELLKAQNIKVNKRSPYKLNTALMLAIKDKRQGCARLLIQHPDTDVNKVSLSLNTALTKARKKELIDIINLLEADPRLSTPLDRMMRVLRR